MEHTKSGLVQPEMYKEFHVVYYISRQFPPMVSSQNIRSISLLKALQYFIEVNPDLENDVLYITQKV